MSEIRYIMDPNNTLPVVQFRATVYNFLEILNNSGEEIGNFATIDHENSRHFVNIELNDDNNIRGKGYGLATYIKVIEESHKKGLTFESHPSLVSRNAKLIWDKFVYEKIAEVIKPFEVATYIDSDGNTQPLKRDGAPQYCGLCIIPVLKPERKAQ